MLYCEHCCLHGYLVFIRNCPTVFQNGCTILYSYHQCMKDWFSVHLCQHLVLSWVCILAVLGDGTPLQYSCLEIPMDGGAWWAVFHGVAKSQTWLSDFTFTFHFHALEKEMATHSSVLAWRIPGTGHPGGLLSMGSSRAGHDWSDSAAAAAAAGPKDLLVCIF